MIDKLFNLVPRMKFYGKARKSLTEYLEYVIEHVLSRDPKPPPNSEEGLFLINSRTSIFVGCVNFGR